MADLTVAIRTLESHRDELTEQLNAVNTALAALKRVDQRLEPLAPPVPAASAPKARRRQLTLSEDHKRKLVEGRRRAREARAALTSAASDTGGPVIANWKADGPPRLVPKGADA